MKKSVINLALILTFTTALVSCSHQPVPGREVASTDCAEHVKGEYHSYFDSVERCIEKE